MAGRLAAVDFLPPGTGETQLRRVLTVYRANVQALRRYQPGSYPESFLLLRAEEGQEAAEKIFCDRLGGTIGRKRAKAGRQSQLPALKVSNRRLKTFEKTASINWRKKIKK